MVNLYKWDLECMDVCHNEEWEIWMRLTLLVLDLLLDRLDIIRWFDIKSNSLAHEGLYEDLHAWHVTIYCEIKDGEAWREIELWSSNSRGQRMVYGLTHYICDHITLLYFDLLLFNLMILVSIRIFQKLNCGTKSICGGNLNDRFCRIFSVFCHKRSLYNITMGLWLDHEFSSSC